MKKQIFFFAGWLVLVLCIPLQATEPDQLVGRYYLHGVREVGSELLLKNDGSYAWMLAYGNEDHTSEGRWSRQGNSIVLTAIVPTATGPLFQLDTKKK
ncbi:MAG: hypothetical protein OEL57_16230, partial [Trichlorobacter sp.]|uniref:hypothetical protein n=1 Tax=Trichlorobacter sp. TaxID=2911007 RepID=UPI00255D3254